MALKNQPITVCYVAWNTSTNGGQTGDSANHTLKLIQDGTEASPTNTPAQVDSVNAPGVYSLALTAGDMNYNCVVLCGKSSTPNVTIIPLVIVTERGSLPAAAAGASGGLPVIGSSPLSNLDASVSSRLASGNVTVGGYAAGQDPATLVLDATASSHNTAGTIGHDINAAGTASDPWTTALPGSYSAGQAGYIIGHNLDAQVSTRLATSSYAAAPTAAQVATAVWQDTTAGDFTTAGSIGKALFVNAAPGAAGGHFIAGSNAATTVNITGSLSGSVGSVTGAVGSVTGNVGGNVVGSVGSVAGAVGSVTAAVSVNLSQALNAARAVDAIADTSLTLNDVFHCAIAAAAGQKDASSGTSEVIKTPSTGTVLRTYAVTTSATNPFGANYPVKVS